MEVSRQDGPGASNVVTPTLPTCPSPQDHTPILANFLVELLAAECRLGPAVAGAMLCGDTAHSVEVQAVWPRPGESETALAWVDSAMELVRRSDGAQQVVAAEWPEPADLYDQGEHSILLIPFSLSEQPWVAAFLLGTLDRGALDRIRVRLEAGLTLVNACETRRSSLDEGTPLQRLRKAMDTLSAVNRHGQFGSTIMALCNELASQWQCERVSFGCLNRRTIHVKAVSHSDDFSRKMRRVQDTELAMEECLDQDCEIIHPADAESIYVSRMAAELSQRHGPICLASFPLRRDEGVSAAVTLERPADHEFAPEDIEAIRLTLELCTPRVLSLHEESRWLGARVVSGWRRILAAILGPQHTWTKLAALIILGVVLFLTLARGPYRAEASFILESTERQVIPAPFDGYIKAVGVEVGDTIEAHETLLAELETVELRLDLAAAKAEKIGFLKQNAEAMRDGQTTQAQIALADADKAQAQIELYLHMIDQARLCSASSGTLVAGDLKQRIGAPVSAGDVLFEVMSLGSLRAVLHVTEDQVVDIRVGQAGSLATASYPGQRTGFTVERINPIAEIINQENVFKVRVHLLGTPVWMRPGMEGVARIDLGRQPYLWIWTRKIQNWIRMKLWW